MRRLLRLLLTGILWLLIAANLARAWLATQQAQWLANWQPSAYIASSGLFWALGFAICAYGLASAQRWPAARSSLLICCISFTSGAIAWRS